MADLERIKALDRRLVKAVKPVRILSSLAWPEALKQAFVERWRAGDPRLPQVPVPKIDLQDTQSKLDAIISELGQHPLESFLRRTAYSWHQATAMLMAHGSPRFTELSRGLYGAPRDRMHADAPSHVDVARHFLDTTDGFAPEIEPPEPLDTPAAVDWLQAAVSEVIPDLPVIADPRLAARATAGSKRVRLRAGTRYPRGELEQLVQHEALVHSLTARNGRTQPILRSLGYGAPRTTCTQEGLATFAELITDTMAVHRLRRIALRTVAVDAAIEGADFVEVFRMFLEAGQTDTEACHSASRVFRGGDVRGKIAFTKDVVYLKGTLLTHAFLLTAQKRGRGDLVRTLFVGRLTWDDAVALHGFVGEGIEPAPQLPTWAGNDSRLAAYLTWSALHRGLNLEPLALGAYDAR